MSDKRVLVTQAEVAEICGVSRTAVNKAVRENRIAIIMDGKRPRVDLLSSRTQSYMKNKGVNLTDYMKLKAKELTSVAVVKKLDVKVIESMDAIEASNEIEDNLARRKMVAETEKLEYSAKIQEVKAAQLRGELLSLDAILECSKFFESLFTELDRSLDSGLIDVSKHILIEGKLTDKHHAMLNEVIMTSIDNAKNNFVKHLKKLGRQKNDD